MSEALTILSASIFCTVPLLYYVAYKYLNMAQVRLEQKVALAEESRRSIREMVVLVSQMVSAYVGFLA